jgi:hypothetical protein
LQPRDSLYIPVDRGLWILLSLLGEKNEKKGREIGGWVLCVVYLGAFGGAGG